jgi:hypothetical protein
VSGENWRGNFQFGAEVTPGTPVAATRPMYFEMDGSVLTDDQPTRMHRSAMGARYNVTALTHGPISAGGRLRQLLSPSESLELFEMGIAAAAAAVVPAGGTLSRERVYKPGNTLRSTTIEYHDGANAWIERGAVLQSLTIAGTVDGDVTVEAEVFGAGIVEGSLTGSLATRNPDFLEGWQVGLAIDDPGDTPFATPIPSILRAWTIRFVNNLARRYGGNFTQQALDVAFGSFDLTADITLLADNAAALAEDVNRRNRVPRLVSVLMRDDAAIEGAIYPSVRVDMPGYWTVTDRGQQGGGLWREYRLTLQGIYDSVLANMVALTAVNTRTSVY